jgi:hypothetical protein
MNKSSVNGLDAPPGRLWTIRQTMRAQSTAVSGVHTAHKRGQMDVSVHIKCDYSFLPTALQTGWLAVLPATGPGWTGYL